MRIRDLVYFSDLVKFLPLFCSHEVIRKITQGRLFGRFEEALTNIILRTRNVVAKKLTFEKISSEDRQTLE